LNKSSLHIESHRKLNRQRVMKLFYYTVNIQHEVTDNNAVFSEDCKGSVWKSGDGGDDVIWENSLRSALLMISSMLKSVYETPRRTRKAFS